jgi:Kef-type K+ transport system membrane component KefB
MYDAYSTNQLTPDLSKESNPLVSVLGMTWAPLLIVLGLLTVYVVYAFYLSTFKPTHLFPIQKGYTFKEFVTFTYLGQTDSWMALVYKFPKDLNRLNNWMGIVLTKGLVFAGGVSTMMWLFINYTDFYKNMHSAQLVYSILIIGFLAIIYFWNKKMYATYLSETN